MELADRFVEVFRREGLGTAILRSARYVAWKIRAALPRDDRITVRKKKLARRIDRLFNSTVAYGPFAGLQLSDRAWWGAYDRAPMLLGFYECEVAEALLGAPASKRVLVDLGAGDGYFGVGGVFCGRFDRSYCFEASTKGQAAILSCANLNGVVDRVSIFGTAALGFFSISTRHDRDAAVVLVDIEGGEFGVLDREFFSAFSGSVIVVELHDWLFADGSERRKQLIENAGSGFSVDEITTAARDPSTILELSDFSDDDRWLACSEDRPRRMTWLRFSPPS